MFGGRLQPFVAEEVKFVERVFVKKEAGVLFFLDGSTVSQAFIFKDFELGHSEFGDEPQFFVDFWFVALIKLVANDGDVFRILFGKKEVTAKPVLHCISGGGVRGHGGPIQ